MSLVLCGACLVPCAPARLAAVEGVIFDASPESFQITGQLPALCEVTFQYSPHDLDAHVKTLRLLPREDAEARLFYDFELSDNDGAESASTNRIRWYDAWDHPLRREEWTAEHDPLLVTASSGECRSRCWVDLSPLPEDREVVLAGVELEFRGEDRHRERVAVIPRLDSRRYEVVFKDGSDDRAFVARIAYALVRRTSRVKTYSSLSTRDETEPIDRPGRVGYNLIQGFDARFMNGDHHLETLNLDVCDGGRIRGQLNDHGGVDDPYRLDAYLVWIDPYH